ncbi:hypothetical protein [Paramaledivibacter caminithermalis]|jgi:hypothetical protein|uniref:Uncharacterized protein n=1 Tax=Paramaledivibacter caminithermalis (strain DSM 15212 / CIP 107654 / DViRD3) TaxID=1121301 RepID=A0A1M6MI85_PARC5|nr:hypothetical protein [Paramaledivibacter caminithermalis]SHJ82993.1 hypothetical protein SAMN02745912_01262 [Paramaledivibacter caminithermalis DSM 15212]
MLSIFRSGPKVIIIESSLVELVKDCIIKDFKTKNYDINTALEKSTENTTIIFLTHKRKDVIKPRDVKDVLFLENQADSILCKIISDNKYDIVSSARMAPRIIIMKTFGNTDKVIDQILHDYDAEAGKFTEMLENSNKGTIVAFTQRYLNEPINLSDLYERAILIDKDYPSVMRELKIHDLKYLNIGFDNKDWYELTIKIYDSYGEYKLHYQRLLKILEYLELGFILGESWGKDAATVFLSVGVYRIRFFTYYDPKYIKKILLGLEYLEDGTRIVDLDLYNKRRKVYWSDVMIKGIKNKEELSGIYRKEIFAKLNDKVMSEVLEMEKQILATRK